jgi:hypothetical protein
MNTFKKLYKEFFGLKEQSEPKTALPNDPIKLAAYNKELEKTAELMSKMTESDIDEAKLVNNITDYRGGVEFVMRDPADASAVSNEIKQWSEKKGFTVVKQTVSKSGKVGYFYFRLGQDPALESQKIQGYLAQKPELKHFRFKVRGEQAPATTQAPTRKF